jgi:SAM-dependent MidA family methyltransferase
MSEQAEKAIRAAIRAEGPIGFDRFMELALYGPGGYYERPPVGSAGDFVTSPHVHPVFGELLGRAIAQLHDALDAPVPFHLTEVGAGDGTLAVQLLDALRDRAPVPTAVEISGGAREALGSIQGVRVAAVLPDEPAHVVLAHELLDNLPFRVVREGRETLIGLGAAARFVEVPGQRVVGVPTDGEHVLPVGAFAFLDRVHDVVAAGAAYVLLIDYGAVGGAGGPLHGYRDHGVVADVLAAPGDTDITAGVDFERVAEHARSVGFTAFPSVTQRHALTALGFEGWFREQLAAQHRQLDERDGMGAVRTWADKSRATLLADPAGLGRHRWLLLATPGLPAPPWLEAALTAAQVQ